MTPADDVDCAAKVADFGTRYPQAPALAHQGERVVSTDEVTGVHALERRYPGLPLAPGHVARREFEYRRHGTCTCILSRDVATGRVVARRAGPSRTDADFLAHIQGVVATDPTARRWHGVVDNLTTHQSASLVQWVAEVSEGDLDLGVKGTSGILHTQQSRAQFLSDPSHHVVLHYTPATARG